MLFLYNMKNTRWYYAREYFIFMYDFYKYTVQLDYMREVESVRLQITLVETQGESEKTNDVET